MTNYKSIQKAVVWYSEYLKDKDKKKHDKWGWRLSSVVVENDEAGLQASGALRGNTDTYSVALVEERGKVRWSCAGHVGKQTTLCSHILFFVLVLVSKRKLRRRFLEQLL